MTRRSSYVTSVVHQCLDAVKVGEARSGRGQLWHCQISRISKNAMQERVCYALIL